MTLQERVGERLKRHRLERGLTQVELAREWNCSRSRVQALEAGRRALSLGVVVELAERLGVTTDELLCGECSPGV